MRTISIRIFCSLVLILPTVQCKNNWIFGSFTSTWSKRDIYLGFLESRMYAETEFIFKKHQHTIPENIHLAKNIHSTSVLCSRFRHIIPEMRHIPSALNLWKVKTAMPTNILGQFMIPIWAKTIKMKGSTGVTCHYWANLVLYTGNRSSDLQIV